MPAALVLAGLIGVYAVPATIAAANPVVPVSVEGVQTLAVKGTKVTLTLPAGWQALPSVSKSSGTYVKDGQTITVNVVGGVKPSMWTEAIDRQLAMLSRDGAQAAYDGGRVQTKQGLEGRTCNIVKSPDDGQCAIVGRDTVLVSLASMSPPSVRSEPLSSILDSLVLTDTGSTS